MRVRGGFSFIFTGLILGLIIGLAISLWFSPVEYANITPNMLGDQAKEAYRAIIATSFNARGDLGRAKARINLLQDEDSIRLLTAQAQQTVAQGGLAQEARGLALLAAALNNQDFEIPTDEPVAIKPVETLPPTEFPTLPPLVTKSPEAETTPTVEEEPEVFFPTLAVTEPSGEPYILKDRKQVCDVEISNLLQVYVIDKDGKPVPGAEIIVTWQDGEDHFFTGMKPAIDIGYADFLMKPDVMYNLRMTNGGESATKISSGNCKLDSGMAYKGGIKIIFGQP